MKYNPHSPLMLFLTKIADLMILNILFILCCIPVITIGAAWTSLYYVAMKMVSDRQSLIVSSFFRSFKQNFRQATILWLAVLAAGGVIFADIRLLEGLSQSGAAAGIRLSLYIFLFLLLMLLQYLFPWLARFETTLQNAFKNAFLTAVGNLPKTFLLCAFTFVPVQLTLINDYTMLSGVFVWMMMAFALIAVAKSCLLVKIFDKYVPAPDNEGAGTENEKNE